MTDYQKIVLKMLDSLHKLMKKNKPGDRSELDRRFAICITELEKFRAVFIGLIINQEEIINE